MFLFPLIFYDSHFTKKIVNLQKKPVVDGIDRAKFDFAKCCKLLQFNFDKRNFMYRYARKIAFLWAKSFNSNIEKNK